MEHSMVKTLILILLLPCVAWAGAATSSTKISGTTNIDDTWLNNGSIWTNDAAGTDTHLYVQNGPCVLIRAKNVSTLLPANVTITSCVCSLYSYSASAACTVLAYPPFKPWIGGINGHVHNLSACDSGATWNDWGSGMCEWTTAGCEAGYDTGHDNSGDGVNSDRKATAMDTVYAPNGGWIAITIDTSLANGWYKGTAVTNGIVIKRKTGTTVSFWSSEYLTDPTKCPFFTFTYQADNPCD